MGVRLVTIYKEDTYTPDSKIAYSFNGQGACCAAFQGCSRYHDGQSMTAQFSGDGDGYGLSQEDKASLFNSRMVQALVPGTFKVEGKIDTIFVPYKDLPGDQVATVVRLAKNWFAGTYARQYLYVRKAYPNISLEDAAVIAVVVGYNNMADSDSSVCFWSPTIAEAFKAVVERKYPAWVACMGEFGDWGPTCQHAVNLLNGEIKTGIQPKWSDISYIKAGSLPAYFIGISHGAYEGPVREFTDREYELKVATLVIGYGSYKGGLLKAYIDKLRADRSLFHTVNYPVCAHKDDSPVIPYRMPAFSDRIGFFMKWVEANNVVWGDAAPKKKDAPFELTSEGAIELPAFVEESKPAPKKRAAKPKTGSTTAVKSKPSSAVLSSALGSGLASSRSSKASSAPKKPRVPKAAKTIH